MKRAAARHQRVEHVELGEEAGSGGSPVSENRKTAIVAAANGARRPRPRQAASSSPTPPSATAMTTTKAPRS